MKIDVKETIHASTDTFPKVQIKRICLIIKSLLIAGDHFLYSGDLNV